MTLAVDYSLFADSVIHDSSSGKMSVIGIFDRVFNSYPVIPLLSFVCFVSGENGSYPLTVQVNSSEPNDNGLNEVELAKIEIPLEIKDEKKAHLNVGFVGLPIFGNRLEFKIYNSSQLLHSASLPVFTGGAKL